KLKDFGMKKREIGTLLMLVTSELAEALEADRYGQHANLDRYRNSLEHSKIIQKNTIINNITPQRAKEAHFKTCIKDSMEDELADALIRILDICGGLGIDIDFHVKEKLWYNSTRPHKHGKSY